MFFSEPFGGLIPGARGAVLAALSLAVIAGAGWDGRTDLEDAVRTRLGNNCDVLVFTSEDFTRRAATGEPVVREILTKGVALIGSIPADDEWSPVMATAEQRNHAESFLKKAEEYLASAEDGLAADRHTPAAGDAIHAVISSKDAIVTMLTGSTSKGKDHATAANELTRALGKRPEAPAAEKALRELLSSKGDVEYGVALVTAAKAETLVRRAQTLLELAVQIVRLGR